MKISIVLATYNRIATLKEVLQSHFNQTISHSDYEILITDDGSTDGTREYLSDVQSPVLLTFHTQEHAGPAKARNWGIHQAKGEFVVFTDDDCFAPSNWLERILDAFSRYPDVVGVSGYQEADDMTIQHNLYAQFEKYAHMGDFMEDQQQEHVGGKDFLGGATNNVAYKRLVLLDVDGFDETFPFAAAEDADLKERIVANGYTLVHVPIKVVHKHPYGFDRLMRQAYVRGVGSKHFNTKHQLPNSLLRFAISSTKVAVLSLRFLLSSRWKLTGLAFLYQWYFMQGVLDYPNVMKKRAIQ